MLFCTPNSLGSYAFHRIADSLAMLFGTPYLFHSITDLFMPLRRQRTTSEWHCNSFARFASIVQGAVLTSRHKLKIANAVVQSVLVDVVNNLRRQKLSPKMLGHNKSMLKDFSALIHNNTDSLVRPALRSFTSGPPASSSGFLPMLSGLLIAFVRHSKAPFNSHYSVFRVSKQLENKIISEATS